MRTIGEIIKQERLEKGYSRERLEKETKIKKEFIKALETQDWKSLPEFPVIQGFVKNIASVLKLDRKQTIALLRRDYPPRSLKINPNPDVSNKFTWSPKLTFLVGIVFVVSVILVYLGFEYKEFTSPPQLQVSYPQEMQVVKQDELTVAGKTDPDTTVKVNNQPVLVEDDGSFSTKIEVFEGTDEIIVKATSRSGKETEIKRRIVTDFEM
jgi:cytoskeletal protein RodZ